MEYNTYIKGKNSIQVTETAWIKLYKDKGYKPAKDTATMGPDGNEGGVDDDNGGGSIGDNNKDKDSAEK